MIQKATGYTSSDGLFCSTLEQAQQHELIALAVKSEPGIHPDEAPSVADFLLAEKDKIIDILTMKPNSLPKARKINGGTKKRAPKHIAAQNTLPLDTTEPPRAA